MIVWSYAIDVLSAISQPPAVDVTLGLVTGPWNATRNGTGTNESFTTCPCRAVCSPSKMNGASAGNINPSDWLGRMLICNDCDGVAESKIISDICTNSTVASACPESNSTPDTFAANVRGRPNTTPASPSMVNDRDVNLPGVARCSDQRHAEASSRTFFRASARDSANVCNVRTIVPGVA